MDIKQQAAYDKVMAEYDAILEMAKQKLTEPDGWCFYFPKGLAMKFPNGKPQVCGALWAQVFFIKPRDPVIVNGAGERAILGRFHDAVRLCIKNVEEVKANIKEMVGA